MNALCNICDAYEAALYCEDCPRFHLYCEDCYKASHKADNKKHHKIEKYNPESKAIFEEIYCQYHPKKVKEYACLTCNAPVCSDCIILGKHKGHHTDSFENELEKTVAKFKEYAQEYKEKVVPSIKFENAILKLKTMMKETEAAFALLNNMINEKCSEILSVIDNVIKEKESIKNGIESTIKSGMNMIKSAKVRGYENYYSLCEITKKLRKDIDACIKEGKLVVNPIPVNFKGIMESLKKIVLTKDMLHAEDGLAPLMENEILENQVVKDKKASFKEDQWICQECSKVNKGFICEHCGKLNKGRSSVHFSKYNRTHKSPSLMPQDRYISSKELRGEKLTLKKCSKCGKLSYLDKCYSRGGPAVQTSVYIDS
eukprot:TRINITY_DN303_c0_g1_i3.p4 TRINITY_DN303_c0_g1~~TRINITY_DN303_c0_g1_i3.p4  ORF type:complete len:371 (+),score=41.62 TRINITY_DN303_c0_g1_i3:142-1254(+)